MQNCKYSRAVDCSECLKTFCPYTEPDFEPDEMSGSSGEYADDEYEPDYEYDYGRER